MNTIARTAHLHHGAIGLVENLVIDRDQWEAQIAALADRPDAHPVVVAVGEALCASMEATAAVAAAFADAAWVCDGCRAEGDA